MPNRIIEELTFLVSERDLNSGRQWIMVQKNKNTDINTKVIVSALYWSVIISSIAILLQFISQFIDESIGGIFADLFSLLIVLIFLGSYYFVMKNAITKLNLSTFISRGVYIAIFTVSIRIIDILFTWIYLNKSVLFKGWGLAVILMIIVPYFIKDGFKSNKKPKLIHKEIGGLRIGQGFWLALNMTWPLAKLEIYKDKIILTYLFFRKITFEKNEINYFEETHGFYTPEIKIVHNKMNISPYILFWSLFPDKLLDRLKKTGYPTNR